MRYLLFWHARDEEFKERDPKWHEELAAFLSVFENQLAQSSELEWVEALAPEHHAFLVGPGGRSSETRKGCFNIEGSPLTRVWAVRVTERGRALEIANELADGLGTWVEVRECLEASQRP